MADIIAHYNPKLVELHNYIATGSAAQKVNNWKILNGRDTRMQIRYSRKMNMVLTKEDI